MNHGEKCSKLCQCSSFCGEKSIFWLFCYLQLFAQWNRLNFKYFACQFHTSRVASILDFCSSAKWENDNGGNVCNLFFTLVAMRGCDLILLEFLNEQRYSIVWSFDSLLSPFCQRCLSGTNFLGVHFLIHTAARCTTTCVGERCTIPHTRMRASSLPRPRCVFYPPKNYVRPNKWNSVYGSVVNIVQHRHLLLCITKKNTSKAFRMHSQITCKHNYKRFVN